MTPEEIFIFASTGTRTGKLATVRSDGRPHVAPVWFVVDGQDLVFNTARSTVKGRNLLRDGRAAMSIDDESPPYAFVFVEGTVTLSEDLEMMLPWSIAIGGRYMGEDRAEEFGRRNAVEGEMLVRLTPTSMVGRTDLAG